MTYTVVIEQAPHNYAAFVPDLPGCIATGATVEEVTENIRQAIVWHIDALREEHVEVPEPRARAALVDV
ncbi:MAG: type II toxin-antitoxin system HicB family antitoxin [Nitrolancea sp.]